MSQVSNPNFRYDINALRAIAVTAVLFFHYKVPGFAGGFSGVDVFFVISGYLMSKIILTGIDKGNFSIGDFYSKRLKRIVPALLFLIVVVTIVGFFTYFPGDYQLNQKNAASSILFISNIFYWQNSGYFAAASDTNVFLHTWSLSVEWQFYMIYPLILLGLRKVVKDKTKFLIIFSIITFAFCAGSIVYSRSHRDAAFYLLPARCWEMMFGGIALLAQDYFKNIKRRKALVLIGYMVVFAGVAAFNSDMRWPGKYTIVPVVATFFIIALGVNDFKLLKSSGVQLLGKISYSLYLWHWPVYVIAQYMSVELNYISISVMTLISCGLGYLSFTYIESYKFNTSKPILALMAALIAVTGLSSFYVINNSVFNSRALQVFNYNKDHLKECEQQFSVGTCFISSATSATSQYDKTSCLSIIPGKKNIILIGDSHAGHIADPLKKTLAKNNVNMMQASASRCVPIVKKNGAEFCSEIMDYVYKDFITKNADKIDGVMISADWANIKNDKQFVQDMRNTIDYLGKYKIKMIIIGQNETFSVPYPTIKAKEIQYGLKLTKRYLTSRYLEIDGVLKNNFSANYVDIINDTIPDLTASNVPYMFDKDHYTTYGADLAIKKLLADPITQAFLK